jgi:hypothetical protein
VDVPDLQAEVGLLFEELRSTALEPNLKFPLKEKLKTNSEDQLKINSDDQLKIDMAPKKHLRSRIAKVFFIIFNAVKFILRLRNKTTTTNFSNMALSLQNAVSKMNIVCVPQDEKKRAARKGKGSTHVLFTTHLGGLERVDFQMPRTTTFGCRQSLNNAGSGAPPKYQVGCRAVQQQTYFLCCLETFFDPFFSHSSHDSF